MEDPSIPKREQVFSPTELYDWFGSITKMRGIRFSKEHNVVLLINSARSNYEDIVDEKKGEVIYTGTGEKDQEFGTGNPSAWNSKVKDPNSVLLYFEKPKRTYIFKFPVKYVDHHYENEENRTDIMRRVIKFRLKIQD